MRANERKNNELRSVEFIPHYIINPEGAVLVSFGNTKVICTATIEHKLPPFMRGQGKGWITAEYSMLPRATNTRNIREAARGKVSGRTMEIQRLIGRSLRAAVDLEKLGDMIKKSKTFKPKKYKTNNKIVKIVEDFIDNN